ncbi:hypothetical protein GCM10017708_38160 [Arthrobacter citreus]|uniref:hypothetical protein n=2 Tax=Arthrobacter TaxID=1663 RepID=UPI0012650065|nr:hypothetical protein [Arthrobacter gandavensis]
MTDERTGVYPTRMVCTPETGYGSGCDELGLAIPLMAFALVALPWAGFQTLRMGSERSGTGAGGSLRK